MKRNKINEILDSFAAWLGTKSIKGRSRDQAEQALYKVIMECLPEEKKFIDSYRTIGSNLVDPDSIYIQGHNHALSEIRKNIDRVFGKE